MKIPSYLLNAARVMALFENGNSVCQKTEIAGYFTISRAVIRFILTGSRDRSPGSGRH